MSFMWAMHRVACGIRTTMEQLLPQSWTTAQHKISEISPFTGQHIRFMWELAKTTRLAHPMQESEYSNPQIKVLLGNIWAWQTHIILEKLKSTRTILTRLL